MVGIEREERATVLEDDPAVATDDGAAEVVVDRLNERDGGTLVIDDRQIDRIAV